MPISWRDKAGAAVASIAEQHIDENVPLGVACMPLLCKLVPVRTGFVDPRSVEWIKDISLSTLLDLVGPPKEQSFPRADDQMDLGYRGTYIRLAICRSSSVKISRITLLEEPSDWATGKYTDEQIQQFDLCDECGGSMSSVPERC